MNVNDYNNPLKELIVKQAETREEIDKLLAEILKPFVEIEENGKIYFKDFTYKLPIEKQILLLLCGQLAIKRMGITDEDGFSQQEILQFFKTIPEGTIKGRLNTLRVKRFVFLKEKKNTLIERYLPRIREFLNFKTNE